MSLQLLFTFLLCSVVTARAQQDQPKETTERLAAWLAAEYPDAQKDNRRFLYNSVDLNEDGNPELLVGLIGIDFCGTGGCNMLVLSGDSKVLTNMSIVKYPVYVGSLNSKESAKGYKTLYVRTGGVGMVRLAWNGKSYPANPSLAPKVATGVIKGKTPVLMATDQATYAF